MDSRLRGNDGRPGLSIVNELDSRHRRTLGPRSLKGSLSDLRGNDCVKEGPRRRMPRTRKMDSRHCRTWGPRSLKRSLSDLRGNDGVWEGPRCRAA